MNDKTEEQETVQVSTPGSDTKVGSPPTASLKAECEDEVKTDCEDSDKSSHETLSDVLLQSKDEMQNDTLQQTTIPDCKQDDAGAQQHNLPAVRRSRASRRPRVKKNTETERIKRSYYQPVVAEAVWHHNTQNSIRDRNIRKHMNTVNSANSEQHFSNQAENCSLQTAQAAWPDSFGRKVRTCGKPNTRWKVLDL